MVSGYIRARSVSEAVQALAENVPRGRILAGGTDILPKILPTRYKKTVSLVFIDIKRIEELKGINIDGGWLTIGSATTLHELVDNTLIKKRTPVLAQAAVEVGSPEIRNRATVGGNIGRKNSSADLLTPLVGLGAKVEICDLAGRREIPLQELLTTNVVSLGRHGIITAIKVPAQEPVSYGYRRWARGSMGRAYLIAMVGLKRGSGTKDCSVTITLGGAGLWPRRLTEAAASPEDLSDPAYSAALVQRALKERLGDSTSDSDENRYQLMEVLLNEALAAAGRGVH